MRLDAASDSTFGGDLDRIGRDRQRGNAEPFEMPKPGCLVREAVRRILGQLGDHPGLTHVISYLKAVPKQATSV